MAPKTGSEGGGRKRERKGRGGEERGEGKRGGERKGGERRGGERGGGEKEGGERGGRERGGWDKGGPRRARGLVALVRVFTYILSFVFFRARPLMSLGIQPNTPLSCFLNQA